LGITRGSSTTSGSRESREHLGTDGGASRGYVRSKKEPFWEATSIDPQSRLLIGFVVGRRNEALISRSSYGLDQKEAQGAKRSGRDERRGESLRKLLRIPVFGEPYRPARKGDRGRFPGMRYRVKRSLAHLQLIKRRQGGRVVEVLCRVAHGSWKRVQRELERLGHKEPNLSAIERQNGTSRRMNAYLWSERAWPSGEERRVGRLLDGGVRSSTTSVAHKEG
jgi:hypothetical protein